MFSHLPDHSRDQQVGKIPGVSNKPKTDTIHPKPKRVVHFRTRRSAPPSSHREEGLTTSGPTSGSSCAGRGGAAPSSAAQQAQQGNNKRSTSSYRGPPPAKRVTTAGPGLLLPNRKSTTSTTRFLLSRGNTTRDQQIQIKTTGGASSSGTTKNNNFLYTSSGSSCAGGTSNGGTVRTSGTRRSCATGTRSSANYGAAVSRSSIKIAGVRVGKNTTKGKTTSTSRPSTYVVQPREEGHDNCTGSSSSCATSSENYSNESIYNGSSSRSGSSDREAEAKKAYSNYNPANITGNTSQNSKLERTKAITALSAGGKSYYNTRTSRRDKSNSRVVSTKSKSTAGAATAVPKPHKACQFLEDHDCVQRQRNHATNRRRGQHRDIKQCDWSSTKSNPSSSSSWKKSSGTASSTSYNRGNKNNYTYRSQRKTRTRRRRRTLTATSSSDDEGTDRTVGTSELSSNTDIWPYYIDDKNHVRLIDPDEDESDSDPEYTQHEYNKEHMLCKNVPTP